MSKILLTGMPSDSHTWNLVFMELFLQERGHEVTNLGASVPIELVLEQIDASEPDLLLVSTVNGHGGIEGQRLAEAIQGSRHSSDLLLVIGGKLTTQLEDLQSKKKDLYAAGFTAVLTGANALQDLECLLLAMDASGSVEFR